MRDERARRVGHNEALYRQVNERIEDLNEDFAMLTGAFTIVCECGDLECMEQISISREAYEAVRADANSFIVKPGHEEPTVEQPGEHHGEYVVIEKDDGVPQRIAEKTDPRS